MKFNNLIFIYIVFLFLILLNNINFVKSDSNGNLKTYKKKCKIAVLLSGDFNDLGYNYMFNDARIRAESILELDFSLFYKNLDESEEVSRFAFDDAIKQGANLIFVVSSGQTNMAFEYAERNKYQDIYWVIKTVKRPTADLPKVAILDFNTDLCHYTLGYFSAKMSKTGVVGFVSPADYIAPNANAFYLGAKAANPKITFLNIYVGAWLAPEVAYRAAQKLIANKADFLGMSQDDMSVQQAVMDSGSLALGVTGYPTRLIYGSANVGLSYITNWTTIFVKYATSVQNDSWVPYSYYKTSLAEDGSLAFDDYSFNVPVPIQTLVDAEINLLKNDSYVPFRCSPMYADLGLKLDPYGCVTFDQFESVRTILKGDSLSKSINFDLYTIPIDFVDLYSNSMKLGITIVSAFCIFLCIVSMLLVLVYREARVIKSASPAFCILILFGCITIFVGCIIFSQSPTDGACRARVWLLSIGYTIFLGALLVKNWRIWLLFDNPKLKKRAITNWKLYPWVVGILAADILILAFWHGLGNIKAESRIGIDSLSKYEYGNVCASDSQGTTALYILIIFHGLMLLVACFISFKIKVVDIDEFNESKPITTSIYIITFCLFIVIPLMVSPQSVASQTTIICVCSIVTTMVSVALLFGSKFYMMATQGVLLNQTFATSTKSSSFSLSLDKQKKTGEDSDDSDESEKDQKKVIVTQQSVLAQFTDDTEDTSVNNNNNNNSNISKENDEEEKEEKLNQENINNNNKDNNEFNGDLTNV